MANYRKDILLADNLVLSELMEDHIHAQCKVYPTLANPVTVTGGAGAWALSAAFWEIVPASTITSQFDIHWISVRNMTAVDVYEVVLYAGEVEIGRQRVEKTAVQDSKGQVPFMTTVLPANTQIQAKLASSSGGDSADISIAYHTY